CLYYKTYPRTF
nr:immunoglobulin light chain junction region [Macaca mulatta]